MKKIFKTILCLCISIVAFFFVGCKLELAGDEQYEKQDAVLKNSFTMMQELSQHLIEKSNTENIQYENIREVLVQNINGLMIFSSVNLTLSLSDSLEMIKGVSKDDDKIIIDTDSADNLIHFYRSEYEYRYDNFIIDGTEEKYVYTFDQEYQSYKCLAYKNGNLEYLFESVREGDNYKIQIYNYQTFKLIKAQIEYKRETILGGQIVLKTSAVEDPVSIFDNIDTENFMTEQNILNL